MQSSSAPSSNYFKTLKFHIGYKTKELQDAELTSIVGSTINRMGSSRPKIDAAGHPLLQLF
jgi:hypothetical protein